MASLSGIGAQLGNTGTVKLSELNATNSTTRDYTTTGYYKVNPAEIATGDAPAKAAGTPATLSDWETYTHWDADVDGSGSNLRITELGTTAGSAPNASVTVAFTLPSRYSDFTTEDAAMVNQELYVRQCTGGTPYPTNCLGLDPFGGTRYDNGDGTTLTTGFALDADTWYVLGVRMTWNDQNSTSAVTQFFQTGEDYHANGDPDSSLSGLVNGGAVQDTQNNGRNIVFQTEPACQSDSLGVSTDVTDPDGGCTACAAHPSSTVTRYRKENFGNGIGIYTDTNCTNYDFTNLWVAADGNTAYRLVAGIIESSTGQVDCTTECGLD